MTDTTSTMSDAEIAAQVDFHKASLEALLKLQQARAPAVPVISQPDAARKQLVAERRPRWELAARAFRRFGFEPHTVRRICSNHLEWAKRLTDGAWHVDADLFDEFAARVERGEATFAVSAKSALSVASDAQPLFSYAETSSIDEDQK
ncbi:hypothetical protein CT676_35955 [Bradyrhizobium sp. MOS001]|uniref:hypothetical protein n=1 Tax=unclassified Bradyrhizobium TaxID=2631580 RepID=UPI001075771C|nr:hypothetical protein [Bradyrhizobium sp. MOS001]TFW56255.1 hypothetical protein CT676_35955 [Bradyrhizobium sp. MOS001]